MSMGKQKKGMDMRRQSRTWEDRAGHDQSKQQDIIRQSSTRINNVPLPIFWTGGSKREQTTMTVNQTRTTTLKQDFSDGNMPLLVMNYSPTQTKIISDLALYLRPTSCQVVCPQVVYARFIIIVYFQTLDAKKIADILNYVDGKYPHLLAFPPPCTLNQRMLPKPRVLASLLFVPHPPSLLLPRASGAEEFDIMDLWLANAF